jgi:hypothetical protein
LSVSTRSRKESICSLIAERRQETDRELHKEKSKRGPPTHRIWLVRSKGEQKKDRWTEIGAIWLHKGDKGGSIVSNMIPLEMINGAGRIVYRAV